MDPQRIGEVNKSKNINNENERTKLAHIITAGPQRDPSGTTTGSHQGHSRVPLGDHSGATTGTQHGQIGVTGN